MKKICLVVQYKRRKEALVALRELGVMHVENTYVNSAGISGALLRKSEIENAFGLLEALQPKKKKHKQPAEDLKTRLITEHDDAHELEGAEGAGLYSPLQVPVQIDTATQILRIDNYLKILEINQLIHVKERDRVAAWGNFEPEELKELEGFFGYPLYLYETSPEALESIPAEMDYIKICGDKTVVYLMALGKEIPGLQRFIVPEQSLSSIESEIAELDDKQTELRNRIKTLAASPAQLKNEREAAESRLEFERALAEFVEIEGVPQELSISCLTGYTLIEDTAKVKALAAKNAWAFMAIDPGPEDEVPVKLKNNRFVQIVRPLTGFLDIVPGYREADISLWILIFFSIFFGMIFGDAGYGFLLLLGAFYGFIKNIRREVPLAFKFLGLLGLSNILWGALTCSWFGIAPQALPQFLRDISLPAISLASNPQNVVDHNLQLFCFSLALVHLNIARINNIARAIRNRSLKVFAEIGSIAILFGVYNLILVLVVSDSYRSYPMLPFTPHLIVAGLVLSFLFAYYEGSIVKSLLDGLTNIMSVLLGVTGAFSDVMSYIRLWALGLAGASIATLITEMVTPMLGSFLVFAGIVILALGHGLNMILNTLAVLIHGVRLNTLEFSSHSGVTWSGIEYKPFMETAKK